MIIYVTQGGREKFEKEIENLLKELKELTDEKNHAYTHSGDTWHDNPTFNELEQRERRLAATITQKKQFLSNAKVIEITKRNISKVSIGSIVKLSRFLEKQNKSFTEIWEIAGFGESDIKQKKVAYNTPLGNAIFGLKVGEKKTLKDNMNGIVNYEILELFNEWNETKSNK